MKRKTHEEYLLEFNELSNGEYSLESKYINAKTKIKIRHIKCDNVFEMAPNHFKQGQRCPKCKEIRKSNSLFNAKKQKVLDKLKTKCGTEYELLSEYKGYREELKLKHIHCGHIWLTSAYNFLSQDTNCPKCSRKHMYLSRRLNSEEFAMKFNEKANNEFELLSSYVNKRTKIKVKHVKCNNEWEVRPLDFLNGSGCPLCNESRGEREVRKILDKYNYKYIEQYRFEDCKNKNTLPFDFAVFNNDNLLCLIEYQGEQHYKESGYFKGKEKLEYTQYNDAIKKNYCIKNNINLIIIPYWEFSKINKIIKNIESV